MNGTNLDQLTDEKLLQLCQQYGEKARSWRQKFAGLLPEVNKRQLYAKKGFRSIFEFAAKLAGISEEQVRRVLNLEKKFEDKPMLQSLLVSGEVSANKLVRVASIATVENQEALAEHVKILPQKALETLVRDEKLSNQTAPANVEGQPSLQIEIDPSKQSLHESLRAHTKSSQLFDDVKLLQKFSEELKEKLQQLNQKGIDINQLLLELLKKREEEIEEQKSQIAGEMSGNSDIKQDRESSKPSLYIPVKIKRIITQEHGAKCSISTCTKPSRTIHHTQRFALVRHAVPHLAHDPHYLAPLCKEHHTIAHSVDLKFHEKAYAYTSKYSTANPNSAR